VSDTVDITVIGAGLSGLALAGALRAEGRDVILLEARTRPGGRVMSQGGYDLGPAWIWPHNARMLALVDRLGLPLYAQHSAGRLVFEDAHGAIRRDLDLATMGGSLRVGGGLARITDRMAEEVGDALRLGHTVLRIGASAQGVEVIGDGFEMLARRVILAMPPRLAAGLGVTVPDVPTWMAGHAKLVAVYNTPFWRAAGLNGDAISHLGPLAEVHDASPENTAEGALFGFALPGTAASPDFRESALAQLARLFGPEASAPRKVIVKDWSRDPLTATEADRVAPPRHPAYRAIAPTARIIFAGTETAPHEGGFLEGALEAAEAAHQALERVAI
jgi:monoamine oxidase